MRGRRESAGSASSVPEEDDVGAADGVMLEVDGGEPTAGMWSIHSKKKLIVISSIEIVVIATVFAFFFRPPQFRLIDAGEH